MSNDAYNSRTADKFVLRLPEGMRSRVNVEATDTHVSMNTYMIQSIAMRLEKEARLDMLIKLLENALAKESVKELKLDLAFNGVPGKPEDLRSLFAGPISLA